MGARCDPVADAGPGDGGRRGGGAGGREGPAPCRARGDEDGTCADRRRATAWWPRCWSPPARRSRRARRWCGWRPTMAERVEIFEVGPRDGLQNEKRLIPTAEKIALVDCLSRAGFARIEVASFVSPKWVPQMADGAEVLAGHRPRAGRALCGAHPEPAGLRARALAARRRRDRDLRLGLRGVQPKANINATIAESLDRFAPVREAAAADGLPMRGYVSCVTDCPYDGPTPPGEVARVAAALFDLGCSEVEPRRHDRDGHARDHRGDAGDGAGRRAGTERLAGHYPRHRRPGAGQYRGVAWPRPARLRRGGGRAWRLPLRARGAGQRGDRGGRCAAARRWATTRASTPRFWPRQPRLARGMRAAAWLRRSG